MNLFHRNVTIQRISAEVLARDNETFGAPAGTSDSAERFGAALLNGAWNCNGGGMGGTKTSSRDRDKGKHDPNFICCVLRAVV